MSPDTVRFLLELLSRQQVAVGAPDFEELVAQVIRARRELAALLPDAD